MGTEEQRIDRTMAALFAAPAELEDEWPRSFRRPPSWRTSGPEAGAELRLHARMQLVTHFEVALRSGRSTLI